MCSYTRSIAHCTLPAHAQEQCFALHPALAPPFFLARDETVPRRLVEHRPAAQAHQGRDATWL